MMTALSMKRAQEERDRVSRAAQSSRSSARRQRNSVTSPTRVSTAAVRASASSSAARPNQFQSPASVVELDETGREVPYSPTTSLPKDPHRTLLFDSERNINSYSERGCEDDPVADINDIQVHWILYLVGGMLCLSSVVLFFLSFLMLGLDLFVPSMWSLVTCCAGCITGVPGTYVLYMIMRGRVIKNLFNNDEDFRTTYIEGPYNAMNEELEGGTLHNESRNGSEDESSELSWKD